MNTYLHSKCPSENVYQKYRRPTFSVAAHFLKHQPLKLKKKTLKGLSWSEIDFKLWCIFVRVIEEWLKLERKQELEAKGIIC